LKSSGNPLSRRSRSRGRERHFFAPKNAQARAAAASLFRRPAADRIIGGMTIFAAVDLWYVAACTAVPILWGAAVHMLFDVWQRRRPAKSEPPAGALDSEAEEPNLP
jgi:hypothetical protein